MYSAPLIWDIDVSAGNLAKAANIKVDIDELPVVGRILTYMEIMTTLKIASIFAFVNLGTYINQDQMRSLLYESRLKKYCILLLENRAISRLTEFERHLTIDVDLCEVINDFANIKM